MILRRSCAKNVPMIPLHIRSTTRRAGRVAAFGIGLAAFAIAACSSDPRNGLGSDNDLISSDPGVVYDDTLGVVGDTVVVFASVIGSDAALELGQRNGYTRSMVIQISFTGASGDVSRTVEEAFLRLTVDELTDPITARFYQLADSYAPGDSIESLDTLSVIVDPETDSPTRTMQSVPRDYPLPNALVQGWIRNEIERNAIGIVTDIDTTVATFKSAQAVSDRPQIVVNFVGGFSSIYRASGDATFVQPTGTTSNLIASDGYVRRIYFRLPLDQLEGQSAIHNARLRLYVVPGSVKDESHPTAPVANMIVYIPASDDPSSTEFRDGQLVTTTSVAAGADFIEFTMTNAIALMLQGTLENHGVVMRYDAENSAIRQVEFYGTSAPDSLRPRLFITSSTPADFDPVTP